MTLELTSLSVQFDTPAGPVQAVDGVSLWIEPDDRLALVGESGCGKSVLALAVLGLLPRNARCSGGATFGGRNLLDPGVARALRGREIAMCWSNAERFFNPVIRVGEQIREAYLVNHPGRKREAKERAMALLRKVGFAEPQRVYAAYPSQLSGGMNQRAMIAMSLINEPQLLLVDEPTRGLDDGSRDCVVKCLSEIYDVGMLMITHDMALVREIAHGAFFMSGGRIRDYRPCSDLAPASPAGEGIPNV